MKVEEAIKSGKFYTYVHIRNDNNKVFYVGKGKGRRVLGKTSRNRWWKNIADKHGFHAEILFIHYDETSSFKAEEFFIKSFREQGYDLVNQTDGGEGASGYKHTDEVKLKMRANNLGKTLTEEHKLKISNSLSGENNHNFGKKFSIEHLLNMRNARLGKKHSDKAKEKMSAGRTGDKNHMYGKTHSVEAKEKISRIHKGKNISDEHKKIISSSVSGDKHPNFKGVIIATNLITGVEVEIIGLSQMREMGFSHQCVYRVMNNPNKSHRGYTFKRNDDQQ